MNKNLYLIEFYTKHPVTGETGWAIAFAWVYAPDKGDAIAKLMAKHRRFDCVIQCEEQSDIFPLRGNFRCNTPEANLFIIS